MYCSRFIIQKYTLITLIFKRSSLPTKHCRITVANTFNLCCDSVTIHGATQNFREFEYTAQTVSATNLRRQVPLFVSFNQQCGNWRLYECTCFRVLAVFFTPFSRLSAIIELAGVKEQRTCIKFCFTYIRSLICSSSSTFLFHS